MEYKNKDKTGSFVDRRFGETDENMTVEEKMLERFTKEKQRRAEKSSIFNLESDEEELTHFGQSLSKLDDIADHDPRLDVDDQDATTVDRRLVSDLHFGGFGEGENSGGVYGKKSYREIMAEVMAKSKYHKAERQRINEENEDLRRQLNSNFEDIRSVLLDASNEHKRQLRSEQGEQKKDDYDLFVRELAYERKAKPTDRLKTEEEIAKEEVERLEKLEHQRLRRMQGLPSDSEDEYDGQKSDAAAGGDDLEVNYVLDEPNAKEQEPEALVYKDGKLVNAHALTFTRGKRAVSPEDEEEESGSEEDDESEEENEDEENGSESEQSDGEESEAVSDEEDSVVPDVVENRAVLQEALSDEKIGDKSEPDEESESETSASLKTTAKKSGPFVEDALPYKFDFPENYSALLVHFQNRSLEDQITIVQRIRTLYHKSLKPENGEKLQSLLKLLVQHFELAIKYLTEVPSEREKNPFAEEIPLTLPAQDGSLITSFVREFTPIIIEMAQAYPEVFVEASMSRLKTFHKSFLRRPIASLLVKQPRALIRPHELLLCFLLMRIFSTSDFKHVVVTPLVLILGEWLTGIIQRLSCPVSSDACIRCLLQDIATGMALCQIYFESQQHSQRYMPEVINFLATVVRLLGAKFIDADVLEKLPYPVPSHDHQGITDGLAIIEPRQTMSKPSLFDILLSAGWDVEETKMQLFSITAQTIKSFADMCASHEKSGMPEKKQMQSADSLEEDVSVPLSAIYVHLPEEESWPWHEVFLPFIGMLQCLAAEPQFESSVKDTLDALLNHSSKLAESRKSAAQKFGHGDLARLPLQLHRKQPVKFKSLAPKFQERFNPDRHYDPNPRRSEDTKMRKLYQKELKGAVRELKKDAAFLANTKLQEVRKKDGEYQKKMKRVYGIIGSEQAESGATVKRARR